MSKQKILVIEDDVMMQRIFERLLAPEFEPTILKDQSNILEHLKTLAEKPDLVILDIMMPNVSGIDILKALKADESWKPVPVIVITNMGADKYGKEATALGAKQYLVKSEHDPKELIEFIKKTLTQH